MKSRDEIVLEKILKYCTEIDEACSQFNGTLEIFTENFIFRNACSMCILQIGELCKYVSDDLRQSEKQIPWRAWCGIRDIFAHQYSNMDYEVAWETIKDDIPFLEEQVKIILKKYQENDR